MKTAIVIGAGIGGLAAAIRLAVKGYQVDVYEQNETPGGKISELREQGFRWDTGPSLFTLPELVDELFILAGRNARDYYAYHRLPLVCRYFFEDGTEVNAWAGTERFAEEISHKTHDRSEAVKLYLQKSKRKYELTKGVFLHRSLHRLSTYFTPSALWAYPQLYKLDGMRTLHRLNVLSFRDDKTVRIFDRFATYNGSNPYYAPATLSLIPHLEHDLGAWYPQGGMYSIVQALVKLAQELDVHFHYGAKVENIDVQKKVAKGIYVNGNFQPANVVISNADVWHTYRRLMPEQKAPEKILEGERSSSALIFYWGIQGQFPQLDLHNIFFTENYLKEFNALFKTKELYDDPTIYVYISARENPADAPQGCENWFVMINVPGHTGQDWEQLTEQARTYILRKLNRMLKANLQDHILTEKVITPQYLEERTSSYQGALYGNASNTPLAAFFRHPNFSSRIKGLYFCGGSVHPGGGIPLCLLSAKIAVNEISD